MGILTPVLEPVTKEDVIAFPLEVHWRIMHLLIMFGMMLCEECSIYGMFFLLFPSLDSWRKRYEQDSTKSQGRRKPRDK